MPRIPTIQRREDLPAEHQAAWDAIAEKRGRVSGPFTVLLHSPELASRIGRLGAYVRFEGVLPDDARELAIITVAREMDCRFEWAAHAPLARKAGVPEETIAAVRDRTAPAGLPEAEAGIVRYVQQLLRTKRVDEPTFRSLEQRFGMQGLVELTGTIGHYLLIACTLNAFDVTPDAGMEDLN